MPDMSSKAQDIDDPIVLAERIAYRNSRLLDKLSEKDDPVAFVRLMGGHNKTDLNRLLDLLRAG
jgi:hypothetical protein